MKHWVRERATFYALLRCIASYRPNVHLIRLRVSLRGMAHSKHGLTDAVPLSSVLIGSCVRRSFAISSPKTEGETTYKRLQAASGAESKVFVSSI